MFDRATIILAGGRETEWAELLGIWRSRIVLYPCGTPRTKHLVTNPIFAVDESGGTATCRSYYTVLQQLDGQPIQVIAAGRYHDAFRRHGGEWHFASRDCSHFDRAGDLTGHLLG